MKILARSISF